MRAPPVRVRQRQSEQQREDGEACDRDGRGPAAGQPGERPRKDPFASHGEQDPDGRVDARGDEAEAGEHDHEIAAGLFVSPNTIKSQAMSIYRKLGASSRNQAVTRSRELGLLEG
jgi:ABC-type Zn2+ transport system substrate-binding protein/surface adhesin